jgi:hypothetical protein
MRESGISNSENLRFEPIRSKTLRHLFLPSMWRTNVQRFYLYRLNGLANTSLRSGCRVVDFGPTGDAAKYILSGWGDQEATFRWTTGPEAGLQVSIPDGVRMRKVRLTASAFAQAGGSQRVGVLVDHARLTELTVGPALRTYDIDPGSSLGAGEHRIIFHLPDARSPRSVGFNDDQRLLGIAVSSLMFDSGTGDAADCKQD